MGWGQATIANDCITPSGLKCARPWTSHPTSSSLSFGAPNASRSCFTKFTPNKTLIKMTQGKVLYTCMHRYIIYIHIYTTFKEQQQKRPINMNSKMRCKPGEEWKKLSIFLSIHTCFVQRNFDTSSIASANLRSSHGLQSESATQSNNLMMVWMNLEDAMLEINETNNTMHAKGCK